MADGRDDNYNYPPNRGAKLRHHGSAKTGVMPDYSEEMDYTEGGSTHLNQRTRMKAENYSENSPKSQSVRDEGLNLKQPV
jgi:hypothetical protein